MWSSPLCCADAFSPACSFAPLPTLLSPARLLRPSLPSRLLHPYDARQEIRDRYPPWLEAHSGKLPADEYGRYVAQYEAVQRVCEHYEKAPADYAKLMDLIQEVSGRLEERGAALGGRGRPGCAVGLPRGSCCAAQRAGTHTIPSAVEYGGLGEGVGIR